MPSLPQTDFTGSGLIRLVNGPTLDLQNYKPACYKGRIEGSRHDCDEGKWSQICDDPDLKLVGRVTCRDLGFNHGSHSSIGSYNNAAYDPGHIGDFASKQYILDDIICRSYHESIFQCDHKPICKNDCSVASEELGTDCSRS